MVGKIRRFLYVSKPKSADLMLSIISALLALAAFLSRSSSTPGTTIKILENIAPIEVWCMFLFTYSITTVYSTVTDNTRLSIYSGALGTFSWFAVTTTLIWKLPITYGVLMNVSIYVVFGIFAMWSFLSAQEERRLKELYGADYRKLVEKAMLIQILDLQERVSNAHAELTQHSERHKHVP